MVGISRRSVYSRRKPATATDLALMRCIDALSKRIEACHERYPASNRPGGFEQHTDTLAEFAICIASKLEAKVTFVHVVQKGEYFSDYDSSSFEEFEASIQNDAEKKMVAMIKKQNFRPRMHRRLAFG